MVPSASYPTQLQALLRTRYITQQAAITVASSGVPGERATTGATRLPGVLSAVRPEVVLLLEGYNDLALGVNQVGPAATAIEIMAKEARNRGARVYIASLTPPRLGGRNALPADWIATYNARLRSVAAGENAVFVDLYQALVSQRHPLHRHGWPAPHRDRLPEDRRDVLQLDPGHPPEPLVASRDATMMAA